MRRAFTLPELLIVISIIILMLGVAVFSISNFQWINTKENAYNTANAYLNMMRLKALSGNGTGGMGVLFYLDPNTDRINLVPIKDNEPFADSIVPELATGIDRLALPRGVMVQFVDIKCEYDVDTGKRLDDGYLGFNQGNIGGVVFFSKKGDRVIKSLYFKQNTALGKSLGLTTDLYNPDVFNTTLGLVFLNKNEFSDNSFSIQDHDPYNEAYSAKEREEEKWIDQNGLMMIINPYGKIVKSE